MSCSACGHPLRWHLDPGGCTIGSCRCVAVDAKEVAYVSAKQYLLDQCAVADAEYAAEGNTTASAFGHAEVAMKALAVAFLDALPFGVGRRLLIDKAKSAGWTAAGREML